MKSYARFTTEDRKRLEANDEIGEVHTDAAWKDAFRMSERLLQLRRGLLELLRADDALDDEMLGRFGITRWDIPPDVTAPDVAPATPRALKAKTSRKGKGGTPSA